MSVVIGVRVPKEVKEELDRLGLDYTAEARKLFEEMVRRKKAEETLKALQDFRSSIPEVKEDLAAAVVREVREGH